LGLTFYGLSASKLRFEMKKSDITL
jgi:hypothetical protein